ncbi:ABC transporter permease [Oryzifoliimicrobium ureilyticus]|uniref:ABC transporter permease n=1 Tax=Oryzifoliimicrobium ureilyticus TaxID=3113724 RepID=UPI003076231C
MFSLIRQTTMMVRIGLLGLRRRVAISLSMALSIMLVVIVLAGFLSMAKGFEEALEGSGSPQIAVILGGTTRQETSSNLSEEIIRSIMATRDDLGLSRDAKGELIASRELVVAVDFTPEGETEATRVAVRGMDSAGPFLRDTSKLSQGRLFRKGAQELVVGEDLAAKLPGLAVGEKIRLGSVSWTVVGHLSAKGGVFGSELWGDLDAVRSAFARQGDVQSLRLRLEAATALDRLRSKLATSTTEPLTLLTEAKLYSDQSARTVKLIRVFGWPISLLMALGATAGALNTMASSVSARTIEIATVRALGFSRFSAFASTWVESIVLSGCGALAGIGLSMLIFNGWQASTIGANNARMAFTFAVTGDVVLACGLLGLAIGILGGMVPAMAAARMPLMDALRARS